MNPEAVPTGWLNSRSTKSSLQMLLRGLLVKSEVFDTSDRVTPGARTIPQPEECRLTSREPAAHLGRPRLAKLFGFPDMPPVSFLFGRKLLTRRPCPFCPRGLSVAPQHGTVWPRDPFRGPTPLLKLRTRHVLDLTTSEPLCRNAPLARCGNTRRPVTPRSHTGPTGTLVP